MSAPSKLFDFGIFNYATTLPVYKLSSYNTDNWYLSKANIINININIALYLLDRQMVSWKLFLGINPVTYVFQFYNVIIITKKTSTDENTNEISAGTITYNWSIF